MLSRPYTTSRIRLAEYLHHGLDQHLVNVVGKARSVEDKSGLVLKVVWWRSFAFNSNQEWPVGQDAISSYTKNYIY